MFVANPGKNLIIDVDGKKYARYPVKTRLVTEEDKDYVSFVKEYVSNVLEDGDVVFVSEKIISIMQGRSHRIEKIKPTKLAMFLSKLVQKRQGGIGLGMPETMQLAIEEVGIFRILLAALLAGLTKPFGIKGVFYMVAGDQARAIDGPCEYTIPPYNKCAVRGPLNPDRVAEEIAGELKAPTAIVDINDWGANILGLSQSYKYDRQVLLKSLKDNPLGQCGESTPIGILRKAKD